MKENLALFDLDGTLFDTRDVNYWAYKDALQEYGYELEYEYFVTECNGRHYKEFLPKIMGTTQYLEEVHELKKSAYAKNLHRATVNEQLFNMIEIMKHKYHTAIVTTASRKNCMEILECFGYTELFELIISHEDVVKVKPDPEGYIKAMEYFGINKEHTVIFEDSDVGIRAARNSGANVMKVYTFISNNI